MHHLLVVKWKHRVQILDYKQNTAPRTFHKKVHNVAVNPSVSKLSLMDVKLVATAAFVLYKRIYMLEEYQHQ